MSCNFTDPESIFALQQYPPNGLYFLGSRANPIIWRHPGNQQRAWLMAKSWVSWVGARRRLRRTRAAGAVGRGDNGLLAVISSTAGTTSPQCSDRSQVDTGDCISSIAPWGMPGDQAMTPSLLPLLLPVTPSSSCHQHGLGWW
jgi:hypothetical protein